MSRNNTPPLPILEQKMIRRSITCYSNGSGGILGRQYSDYLHNSSSSRENLFNNNVNQPMSRSSIISDPCRDPGYESHAELPIACRSDAPPPPISELKMIRKGSMCI